VAAATRGAAQERPAPAPPSSEEIQRQREEAERRRLEYLSEKARVDRINEKVRRYKDLMTRIPFEPVPNTSNMVQVYVNGHDIRDVAWRIYSIADGASEAGFAGTYWPTVMFLNRAKDYDTGYPQYGKLDAQSPEINVALFPAIRKQGFEAIVAQIGNPDSSMALQLTAPVVRAYRKRLEEEVTQLAARGGDVWQPDGPAHMPGENKQALFRGLPMEPRESYPPRRLVAGPLGGPAPGASEPVPVDRPIPLEPAPPAWALRQGINMLGPNYEGYNLQYKPSELDLQPEVGPIAFMGARDAKGNARTLPGMHFALTQRIFRFLLLSESAFVAFSAADAPAVNGGSLGAGVDISLWGYAMLTATGGFTAVRVVGATETGPSLSGRVRIPITDHLFVGTLYRRTNLDHFRVEERDRRGNLRRGRMGVVDASYVALTISLR
jgi:hypothetical protein